MSQIAHGQMGSAAITAGLMDFDRRHMLHTWATQSTYEPELIVRAEGAHIWTSAGDRRADLTAQKCYVNVGHGDLRMAAAIAQAANGLPTVFGTAKSEPMHLAERLLTLLPPAYQRVFFGCNGSDAVEAAIKTARLVTGRQGIISFWQGYHGSSMGATSVTSIPNLRNTMGEPVPGSVFVPSPYHYRSSFGGSTQDETDKKTVDFLEETILQIGAGKVAAILGEPVIGSGGGVVPGPAFWRGVHDVARRYEILLISDEIITAFGRLGHWFALEPFDYVPDILLLGKGLTSGYAPLSAAVLNENVCERLERSYFPHGLTYTSNAIGCAAALTNVEIIESDQLIARAGRLGRTVEQCVNRWPEVHPCVGDVRTMGLFTFVELVRSQTTKEGFGSTLDLFPTGAPADLADQIRLEMRRRGFQIGSQVGRVPGNLLWMSPPLVVGETDLMSALEHLDEILALVDAHVDDD